VKTGILGVAITSLFSALFAFAEDSKVQPEDSRISLFSVPLKCEAAPEIGCGSRSKPILLELQRQPDIAEAWLKGTGVVLAVVWVKDSERQSRVEVVESILKRNGAAATELNGKDRETELRNFASREDWYRGAEVDQLSRREATIIASRLIRRVRAKSALSTEQATTLENSLVDAITRWLTESTDNPDRVLEKQRLTEEVFKVARANLDENGVVALEEAIAIGYRPQPEDNEGIKNQVPNCCSVQAR
jgi:hypothetical protein